MFNLKTLPYWGLVVLGSLMIAIGSWGHYQKTQREKAEATVVSLTNSVKAAGEAAERMKEEFERESQKRVELAKLELAEAAKANEERLRSALVAERRDARSLREQLADRCRAAAASEDPAAASDDQAAATGDVLAEALRLQAELSEAAERHASEVRSLLAGWPR
jgi:hypothetical protein